MLILYTKSRAPGFADIIFINTLSKLIYSMTESISVKIDAQSASLFPNVRKKYAYKLYTYYTIDIDLDWHNGHPNI